MEIALQDAAGLVCIWAAKQMIVLLRSRVPMSCAVSAFDVCRKASGGQVCSVPVSTLGGRERGRAVSCAWLAMGAGRTAPRESSTRVVVKVILDFVRFFGYFCSVVQFFCSRLSIRPCLRGLLYRKYTKCYALGYWISLSVFPIKARQKAWSN